MVYSPKVATVGMIGVGRLFQGRYKAILVQNKAYLLELTRYVVFNPVRAQMIDTAEELSWSGYLATAGCVAKPEWLNKDWVLLLFGGSRASATSTYINF